MAIMADHGFRPAHYSYPYGAWSIETNRRLFKRFRTLRSVNNGGFYKVGSFPPFWAAIEFDYDRKDSAVLCKRGPDDILCVFCHVPNYDRLKLLGDIARFNGEEFWTVDQALDRNGVVMETGERQCSVISQTWQRPRHNAIPCGREPPSR